MKHVNLPYITKITDSRIEARGIKTLLFRYPRAVDPGQFFMIWIPGVDEIPMSVSYISQDIKGITFRRVGDATTALYKLKPDDMIGIRGPYGNGFRIDGKHILFVAGGTGIATLAPAIEKAISKGIASTVVIGAKTYEEIFFEERLKNHNAKIHISTDDGSRGYKGYASDLSKQILNKKRERFNSIITCGPEPMMKKLLETCGDIPLQASLERYMKCCIGLCGQCCIGEGLRVCVEGPVFDGKTLKNIEDFGVYRRDPTGRKIRILG
ncbi:MAG: dihydroorotate dehydrogenase electron transfer subunit [Thermoplasmata archaeon]|nr:MAG: dihydroorotate dehydrogenase electron transfer subunit [Thermoplasmata archaeon]RLF34574.1 MAG: dihydroorotate dehydrogenase electron transfer subunit [Thermoplasmata archaeon]